jgi:predicted nucleic acid-binding protein
LDHENQANPYEERKKIITSWKEKAIIDVSETPEILRKAKSLQQQYALKSKDALHVACALSAVCEFFLTTDDLMLKKLKDFTEISVMNPLVFMTLLT